MFTKRVLLLLLAAVLLLQTIFITTVPNKVAASSTLSLGDNNQVELTISARWVNRATINFEIQNIKVNDLGALGGAAQNIYNNAGGDAGILAAASVNNGDFKDGDLLDTPGAFGNNSGKYGRDYCGGNIELISVPNMSFNTGGDTPQLKLSDLRLNDGTGSCIGMLSVGFATVRQDIDVSDSLPNRDIWFDYINADSITRVDNGEKFVRKDTTNADKYQLDTASNTDSCVPKVLIGESERTNGQHLMKGNFETCSDRHNFDVQIYRENIDTGSTNTITPQNEAANQPTCESNNSAALAWLLCGVLDVVDNAITGLGDAAVELLDTNPAYYQDAKLKSVWSYFKNISSFLLIIIGLVMIIGQAVNRE